MATLHRHIRLPDAHIPSRRPASYTEAVELAALLQTRDGSDPAHLVAAGVLAAWRTGARKTGS